MSGTKREDIIGPPVHEPMDSDRRGWLIATCIAVVVIIAAGVFLATRTSGDPGMPGMDMGSEQIRNRDEGTPGRFDGGNSGMALGLDRRHEVGVA